MEPETDYLVHITCVPSKDAGKPVKNKTPKVYYCLRKHVITGIEEEVLTLTSLLLTETGKHNLTQACVLVIFVVVLSL